jgi:hypothetical protein
MGLQLRIFTTYFLRLQFATNNLQFTTLQFEHINLHNLTHYNHILQLKSNKNPEFSLMLLSGFFLL